MVSFIFFLSSLIVRRIRLKLCERADGVLQFNLLFFFNTKMTVDVLCILTSCECLRLFIEIIWLATCCEVGVGGGGGCVAFATIHLHVATPSP